MSQDDERGRGGLEHISTILRRALRDVWKDCKDARQEPKREEPTSTYDDWGPDVDLVRPTDIFRLTGIPMSILLNQMTFDPAFPPYRQDRREVCWWRGCDVDAYLVGGARWTSRTKNPDGSAKGLGPLPDDLVRAQAR